MKPGGTTRALFLGAGDEMRCGVGHFTRLLQAALEKLRPGDNETLTLTQSQGSIVDIWRAVGSTDAVICNFPIVAWKRVILRPLLALAMARLRAKSRRRRYGDCEPLRRTCTMAARRPSMRQSVHMTVRVALLATATCACRRRCGRT